MHTKWQIRKWTATAAVVSALLLAAASQALAQRQSAHRQSVKLSATAWSHFDYNQGAWVGENLVALGDNPAVKAQESCETTAFAMRNNGSIYGTETWTLTFPDHSTLKFYMRFEGIPNSTPGLYTLVEVGSIADGTGTYRGVTGQVTARGQFLMPDPAVFDTPLYLGEVHGMVLGLD